MNNVAGNFNSYGMDGTTAALKKLSGMVSQQATIMSFIDVFMGLTILFGSLILLVSMISRPKAAPPPDAAH